MALYRDIQLHAVTAENSECPRIVVSFAICIVSAV
jgi:hypothetical protein